MNFQPNRTFIFQLGTRHFFYRNGYQYETKPQTNGGRGYAELLFFPTAEGYVKAVYSENLSEHEPAFYKYVYLYKDHLGNTRLSYTLHPRTGKLTILEENNYYPFGLKHGGYNTTKKDISYISQVADGTIIQEILPEAVKFKYYYQEQERQDELGLNWDSFKYRNYDYVIGRFISIDPLAEQRSWLSPYNFIQNNPLNRIDPDGALDNPVFGTDGTYRGNTKEGYTGKVIIYDGDVDFSKMSASDLLATKGADTYDNQRGSLTGDAKSKIWTHIASQLEGQQIYDEKFSMSSIEDSKIYHDASSKGSWNSQPKSMYKGWKDRITGTDKYTYSTTVENIQSSVVVHEWYSHIKKGQGNFPYLKSHRLAYKNVINFKTLWNNTTDDYKGFNMRTLLKYTKYETGRTKIDPLYRNLYKKYKNKR